MQKHQLLLLLILCSVFGFGHPLSLNNASPLTASFLNGPPKFGASENFDGLRVSSIPKFDLLESSKLNIGYSNVLELDVTNWTQEQDLTTNRIAENWIVTNALSVESLKLYSYQEGSTHISTLNHVSLAIWDGDPADPTSSIIWGNHNENVFSSSEWTGEYSSFDTNKPLMVTSVETNGLTLEPGTYWLDWSASGILDSSLYAENVEALVSNAANYETTAALLNGSCEWTVRIYDDYWGDEVSWQLRNSNNEVLLSGGFYNSTNYDVTVSGTFEGPLEFYIESFGAYNDNSPNYIVSNDSGVVVSGSIAGGTSFTQSNMNCSEVNNAPYNDNCEDITPTVLTNGTSVTFNGTTIGATMNGAEQNILGVPTIWHAVTLTGSCNDLTVDFCGTPIGNMNETFIIYSLDCEVSSYEFGDYNFIDCSDGNMTVVYSDLPAGTYYLPILADENFNTLGNYTMNVISEDCLVIEEPDYDCFQGDGMNSNNFENGYTVIAGSNFRSADDFIVEDEFSMQFISLNLFLNPGDTVSSATFYIRADQDGIPSETNIVATINATPTSHEILGSNFGYDISKVDFVLPTPVDFSAGTYWLQPAITTIVGEAYWELTTIGSNGGFVHSSDFNEAWYANPNEQAVFFVGGECLTGLPNDNCDDVTPTVLTNGTPVTFNGTTEGATASDEELDILGETAVWEVVTLTGECNNLTVDFCGTPDGIMNTTFIIYTPDCPATTYVFGSNDNSTCEDGNLTIRYSNLPAGTYYLPVLASANYNTLGEYTMNVLSEDCPPPPPNDDCDEAIALDCGETVTGNTTSATNSGGNTAPDVFYTYTGSGNVENVTISLCGSSFDTYLRVFSDCSLSNQIVSSDDYCGTQSQVSFESDGVSTYYIMVEGFSTNSGAYTLNISCESETLPNDNCGDVTPTVLTNGTQVTFNGTTEGATMSNEEASVLGYTTVWEAVTLTGECNNLTVDYCGTPDGNMDLLFVIYTPDCPATTFVFGTSEYMSCEDGNATIHYMNLPAGTYYLPILADANYNTLGEYTMNVLSEDCFVPEEPDYACFQGDGMNSNGFENGYNITAGSEFRLADDFIVEGDFSMQYIRMNMFLVPGATVTSANFNVRADAGGVPSESNIVASFSATPTSQQVIGSNFGYKISQVEFVLTTPIDFSEGTYWIQPEITSNGEVVFWETTTTGSNGEYIHTSESGGAWTPNANEQAVFFVGGECLTGLPNDNCGDVTPTVLTNGTPVTFNGTTEGATMNDDEASFLGFTTVWEVVTLTGECNNLTIDYCGTPAGNMETAFGIYTPDCPATSYVNGSTDYSACGDGNLTIRFSNLPAGTYYLPVLAEDIYNTLGEYTMNVLSEDCPPPPPNDDCEDAIAVSCGETVTGSTTTATSSGGNLSGDVFYTYTGSGIAETVTASLCGSGFDTYLRVFSDCSLSNQIVSSDDYCGTQSQVSFESDGVSTYYIMVEGFSSNTGEYTLNIACESEPLPNDNCYDVTPTVLTNGTPVTFNGTTVGATMSDDEASFFGYTTIWEVVTLTGECNNLTVDYCGTPEGIMDTAFVVYTPDCPATTFVAGSTDYTSCENDLVTIRFMNLPAGTYYLPVLADANYNTLGEYTMNVLSEDCFVAEEPDYACFQGDGMNSNGFENGQNVTAGGSYRIADDFIVEGNFSMQYIRMNLFLAPGATVTSANFNFRADESGVPSESNIVASFSATPTSQQVIGSNFGYKVNQVEFVLTTPVEFSEGTYWLQPEITSNGGVAFWETTTTGSNGSYIHYSASNGAWYSFDEQAVFFVGGECSTELPNDNCDDVTPTVLTNGTQVTFNGTTEGATGSNEEMNVLGVPAVWEVVTLTGECNNLTVDFCGTPDGIMDTAFIIYTPDCPATSYVFGNNEYSTCGDGNVTIRYSNLPAGTYYLPIVADANYNTLGEYTMNVLSEDCFVAEEPDYACFQGDGMNSNGFENGYNVTSGINFRNADDFMVEGDFSMQYIRMNLFLASGATVTSANFNIRADEGGVPSESNIVASFSATPTSQQVIGSNFGYSINQVEFVLTTPVEFSEGTYWLQPEITSNGGIAFWETTTTGSNGGFIHTSQNNGPWTPYVNEQAVFFVAGECSTALPNDNCDDVTPTVLTNGTPVTFNGTTEGATASDEEMNVLGFGVVWEAVTLTGDCNKLTIDYCGTPAGNMSTASIVYTPDCPATSFVIGSYDFYTCPDGNATIRFTNLPAGTYYIPVIADANYNTLGEYTMNVVSEDCPAPPPNDDCDDAIALECGDTVTGDTSIATNSGGNAAPDVFYTYTGSGNVENVTISLCGSSFDTYLRVFSDCSLSNQIAFNDDYCGTQSQITFTSDGTSTYYIMVEGYSTSSGAFTLNISCEEPFIVEEPDYACFQGDGMNSNGFENGRNVTAGGSYRNADDFIVDGDFSMQYIRMNLFLIPGTNVTSANFNVRADQAGVPSESNIVASFSATPTSQQVIGSNFGYSISQVEFVLTTPVEFSEGTYWLQPEITSNGGTAFWEITTTGSNGGYMHTSEFNGAWTPFVNEQAVFFVAGECSTALPNDNCDDLTPTVLTNGTPVTFNGTTEGATMNDYESNLLGWTAVWEAVTLTGDCNNLTIDYCGTPAGNMSTASIVYTPDCPATSFVIGSYDFNTCPDGNLTLRFSNLPAGTYYIPVVADANYNTLGDYTMNVVSENCIVIEEPDYACFQGDGMNSNGFEDGYMVSAGGSYRQADDFVVEDAFSMQYIRLNLFLYAGDSVTSTTFNVRADQGGAPSESNVVASFTVSPTSQQVIGSNFGLNINQVEYVLTSPVELSAGTYWLQPEVTTNSGLAYWEVTSSGSNGGYFHSSDFGGAWYSLDPYQAVFFVAGECYTNEGNDNCSDVTPTVLTNGTPVTFNGTTEGATMSDEEMNLLGWGAVWHAVTLTGDCNNLTLDYCGTPAGNMSTASIVYTPDCPATSYVIGNYDFVTCPDGNATVRFTNLPAGTYYLPVVADASYNTLGDYTMNVVSVDCPAPPPNDDCDDAIALSCGDSDTGSTQGAMNSGGNDAGDVFYSFTGSGTSQAVTVSLCGSSYDTYLRVFTDCTLSNEVAFNDDFCGLQSELSFISDGTSTYYIMVEGFSSNVGDYVINISCQDVEGPPTECEDNEVLDNGMENAYYFTNGLAVDIPVADEAFTVEGTYITTAGSATTFNFIFYTDNAGSPGTEVDTVVGTIIGSEVIGQNFGYDFIKYNVDFDATVNLDANTTYWMQVQSDAVAWDWTSSMTSVIGNTGRLNDGSGWVNADGGEFVYQIYCTEMGLGDMSQFDFTYYPNPVKDFLNISSNKNVESINAYNLAGQIIMRNLKLEEGKVNLRNLTTGTYVFKVILEGGQIETFKIIKK